MKIERYQLFPESKIDFASLPASFHLFDHLGGFDVDGRNAVLDNIDRYACAQNKQYVIYYTNVLPQLVRDNYSNLTLRFSLELQNTESFSHFFDIELISTEKNFKNFVCSFNGTDHISRRLLTSALYKFGWFTPEYNTKNFSAYKDQIDGNITECFDSNLDERFYRKFILADDAGADKFYNNIYSYDYTRFNHKHNIKTLLDKINQSFIQIVSETMATSNVPFVTEKFLYPIVGKSLWLGYSQPNWHKHISDVYGFKLYTTIFNYDFDSITNPVIRLVELLGMISKFSHLTAADWHDLYLIETDTIAYNYDWYMSKQYLMQMKKFDG
jgi:hypothetical protein